MKQSNKSVKEIKKEYRLSLDDIFEDAHSYTGPNIDETFDRVLELFDKTVESTISQTRQEVIEELVEYTSHTKKCELLDRKDHKCICGLDDILEDLNKK